MTNESEKDKTTDQSFWKFDPNANEAEAERKANAIGMTLKTTPHEQAWVYGGKDTASPPEVEPVNFCSACGKDYPQADPNCDTCHGYGAPSLRIQGPVLAGSAASPELYEGLQLTLTAEQTNHPVFNAVIGLRNAPVEIQLEHMRAFDNNVQSICDQEDEEWMRLACKELGIPKIQPNVVVKEIDHSTIKRLSPDDGFQYLSSSVRGPNAEQQTKALAYRKSSGVRSRVGNSVPPSKSKVKNRQKAKHARKAKKR